jgi:hypothetical protein
MLTLKDTAKKVGCSEYFIYEKIKHGLIKPKPIHATKIGYLLTKDEVLCVQRLIRAQRLLGRISYEGQRRICEGEVYIFSK